MKISKKNFKS